MIAEVNVLIPDNRYYHSEDCELVFDKENKALLLYFRPYNRIENKPDQFLVIFEKVEGYKLSNNNHMNIYDSIRDSKYKKGVLYEVIRDMDEAIGLNIELKKFLTFQPYNSSLEIWAKSYKVISLKNK